MFWMDSKYQIMLKAASADAYRALTGLAPADHYVEKQGRSTGRYAITAAGGRLSFYLKKYYRMPWWQRWLGPLERFPGPRELANLRRAAALGIRVAEPLAAGADRHDPCKSLLAVRELEGYLPLHQFIPARFAGPDSAAKRVLRKQLTVQLADIARRLHGANLYHCDLYLCHFFVREPDEKLVGFDLVLIDLMRLKQSRLSRWRVKDLAQLLFSTDLTGITRTDRLRFFKRYLGITRLDNAARQLLRRIVRKAGGYHRHNAIMARRAAA